MKKPANYRIDNLCLFRIRRATAESLAQQGLVELVDGDSLETRYPLTEAGIEFFQDDLGDAKIPVFRREEPERMDWKIAMRLTTQRFRDSCNPAHPDYDPRIYPGDQPFDDNNEKHLSNEAIHLLKEDQAGRPWSWNYDPEEQRQGEVEEGD